MVKMSTKEAIGPLAFVTILFFLWGFAYGLLDVLNAQFQLLVGRGSGRRIGLHGAYFGAYFVSPLTFGRVVFRKWGFKATFITGLCIYACGTLVFWPSAVLASFPAFLISNFIVGLGVATLEIAGNPFIALCGPPQYAEFRLNISQAVQAIGTVTSPILARKVLFKGAQDASSLIEIQWTYLGIALFDIVLAVIFYYVPLPEASEEDLEAIAEKRACVYRGKVGGVPIVYTTLVLGVFSQFCYVGGQEAVSRAFQQYVEELKPE
jgi:fucose permease